MKANEFVKKFGWEEAKIICNGVFTGVVCYKWVELNIDDLKRLVKSHTMIQSFGSLEDAKEYESMFGSGLFTQAIADVESCQ